VRRLLFCALVGLALAAPAEAAVSVSNDRVAIETRLGHKFVFHSTIENHGTAPARDLLAHLNVVDLSGHTYVDPEDWSSQRTRYLHPIPPGGSTTLTWPLNAVNAGAVGIYVAVLPRSGAPVPPATGPTIRVRIQDRKTLNSGGVLPLALGIPAALGLLALGVRSSRRRAGTRSPA
jgi:hypothetical protein